MHLSLHKKKFFYKDQQMRTEKLEKAKYRLTEYRSSLLSMLNSLQGQGNLCPCNKFLHILDHFWVITRKFNRSCKV